MSARPPVRSAARIPALALVLLAAATGASQARDMATDRPDATESPVPVEAGRWQLEMDGLVRAQDEAGGRTWQAAVLNLKRGLAARTDVQFLLSPFTIEEEAEALGGGSDVAPVAFGLRLKHNLRGADGGPFAMAVLPWVTWQAGGGAAAEAWVAGVAVPVAADLGSGFGGGGMLQASSVHDGAARATWWTATASVSRALAGPLAAYVEGIVGAPGDALDLLSTTASFGLTLKPSGDLQLDAGVRTGLVRDGTDVVFAGLSVRR